MIGHVEHLHRKPKVDGERGIPKLPADRLEIEPAGVVGDYNRYRTEKKAGDPNKAVMLLPGEVLDALVAEGWPVEPGHLGENCTTRGVPNSAFALGQRWRIGAQVELAIAEVCDPCNLLAVLPYVGKERVKALIQTALGRRGWYARVLQPGTILRGDALVLLGP